MQINIKNHYVGTDTGGAMIFPGEYEAGDPLLYGLEEYLVEIGYAVWIASTEDEPAPESDEPEAPKTIRRSKRG